MSGATKRTADGAQTPALTKEDVGVKHLTVFTTFLVILTVLLPLVVLVWNDSDKGSDPLSGIETTIWVFLCCLPFLLIATLVSAAITACRSVRFTRTTKPTENELVNIWLVIAVVAVVPVLALPFLPLLGYAIAGLVAWAGAAAVWSNSTEGPPTETLRSPWFVIATVSVAVAIPLVASFIFMV